MNGGEQFASSRNSHLPTERRGYRRSRILYAATIAVGGMAIGPHANAAAPNECDVPGIVAKVVPAIINIQTAGLTHKSGEPSIERSVGSGAIIGSDGLIVTNQHVIQDAIVVRVTFEDKTEVTAHLVGAATLTDIALLKVDIPRKLPTLSFGDSDALRVGQPVIAIGNPIGVGTSVSTGSISAVNRNLMRTPFDDYIQTDAAINPGNSGGPLLDCGGNIVGINTALLSNNPTRGSIGLGFALPSNGVKSVVEMLQDPRAVPNWIGVQLQDVDARLASLFDRPNMSGAIVTGVEPGSPAAQASLEPGDIITSVGGKEQPDARAVGRAIVRAKSGQPVALSVWRRGSRKEITVNGAPWPDFKELQSQVVPSQAQVARAFVYGLGLHVTAITDEDRLRFGLGNVQGVLIDRVDPGTQAAGLGLQVGNVIQRIGDEICSTPEQATTRLAYGRSDNNDMVAVLVRKETGPQWVTLWVGRLGSRKFLTGGASTGGGAAPTTHEATPPLPASGETERQ